MKDYYAFDVKGKGRGRGTFIEMLRQQLGLELNSQRKEITMLVVEPE